jgi:effector-binding domain-containing protein
MIDTPRIVQTTPCSFAGLRLAIPKDQIQGAMGPGLNEVHAALAAQGVAQAGPWFTHHFRVDPAGWDFEICVPVAATIAASGRVRRGEWPATRAAQATLRGGYEGLGAAWGDLDAWIAAQGLTAATDLFEVYAVGPDTSPDPAAWRTELTRPLAPR